MDDIDYEMHDEADWEERQDFEPDPDLEREYAAERRNSYAEQAIFEREWLLHEGTPHPLAHLREQWFGGIIDEQWHDAKRIEWAAR